MRLTVAKKQIILAAMALTGLAIVAGSSQWEMAHVYDAASFSTVNTVPSVLKLDEAKEAISDERIRFWKAVSQTDAAARNELIDKIDANRASLTKALDDYEKDGLVSDAKDSALLGEDRQALAEYLPVLEQSIGLLKANNAAGARDLMLQHQNVVDKLKTRSTPTGSTTPTQVRRAPPRRRASRATRAGSRF